MIIGEYRHTLDPKKRLSLPAKFRKEFGKKVIMTRGLDHCLFLYSEVEWKKLTEKFSNLSLGSEASRGFNRFMLSGAVDVDIDEAGRVLVPDYLKEYAGLKSNIVVSGVGTRAEIWDESKWDAYSRRIEKEANQMAAKLSSEGAI